MHGAIAFIAPLLPRRLCTRRITSTPRRRIKVTATVAAMASALYPRLEPYHADSLQVSPLHSVYYEESGKPDGLPVLFVHGGPGGGTMPDHRRFFDPDGAFMSLFR